MVEAESHNIPGRSPWISAWSDPVAGINSFSHLMCFADLKDDGDYKLVSADYK